MPHCKLYLQNETICKFEGLDLSDRRKLANEFEYEIPHARFTPAYKLGRWNGKSSFFSIGGRTYINLLEEILPMLSKYNIDVIDNRKSQDSFTFPIINKDSYNHINWPEGHPFAGKPVVLREHQVEVINHFLSNLQSVQEVATSAGKTIITAILSQLCEQYGRTIVIVPNKSLVVQTLEDYENLGLDVGVYFGDKKDLGKTHTICTWQSLNVLIKETRSQKSSITFDEVMAGVVCVISDECHQVKASVLSQLLTEYLGDVPIRWGLTGTIPKAKHEYISLNVALGKLINKVRAVDLQEQGILSNCSVFIKQLRDHGEYKNYQEELKYLTTTPKRLNHIAKMINEIKNDGNTLVLVDRVNAGKTITEMLNDIFINTNQDTEAVFISGATKVADRKERYDEIKISDNQVLIATYGVASVGINIVKLHNIVLLEPGKSFVRVIQSIGRGLRKGFDKEHVNIYDVCSTLKYSKRHLTTRKSYYKDAEYPFTIEKIHTDE